MKREIEPGCRVRLIGEYAMEGMKGIALSSDYPCPDECAYYASEGLILRINSRCIWYVLVDTPIPADHVDGSDAGLRIEVRCAEPWLERIDDDLSEPERVETGKTRERDEGVAA